MADPAPRAPALEALLNGSFNIDRAGSIKKDICVAPPIGCGGSAQKFKDTISAREYTISGLCQQCQDRFFG